MPLKELLPVDVDDVTLAFPASIVEKYMPAMKDIPAHIDRKWEDLISTWFFEGVSELKLTPKPGIDERKALRHIKAILGSFEPKHEHKEAAAAYLMSLWFDDVSYKAGKGKK